MSTGCVLGGLNRSSQHSMGGGCDDWEETLGYSWTEEAVIARATTGYDPRGSGQVLGGDRRGALERGRRGGGGVSVPVGSRWFRGSGGMPPTHLAVSAAPLSERYLSFTEREEIALLRVQGHGVRHIARTLNRSPSTISRELRRNAATRCGKLEYRATTARWHADRSTRRPKTAKLAINGDLRGTVQERLAGLITRRDGESVEGPRVT